jgi:hypothetical protein
MVMHPKSSHPLLAANLPIQEEGTKEIERSLCRVISCALGLT